MPLGAVVISQAQNDLRERLVEEGRGAARHAAHLGAFDLLPATSPRPSLPSCPASLTHTLAVRAPQATHTLTSSIHWMIFRAAKIGTLLHLLQPSPALHLSIHTPPPPPGLPSICTPASLRLRGCCCCFLLHSCRFTSRRLAAVSLGDQRDA